MSSTANPITEADILSAVVAANEGGLPSDAARTILGLHFREDAIERMNTLAERNRRGQITEVERSELEKYLRVGTFLNLIQAKARLSLEQAPAD
jgi:hypothetical protein